MLVLKEFFCLTWKTFIASDLRGVVCVCTWSTLGTVHCTIIPEQGKEKKIYIIAI